MAFNPFTGQFERSAAVGTIDPQVYQALTNADASTDEDVKFLKEHVLKDKLKIRQLKHDVSKLYEDLQSFTATLNAHESSQQAKLQELEDLVTSIKDSLDGFQKELETVKVSAKSKPTLVEVSKVHVDEALVKRLDEIEKRHKEQQESNNSYIANIVSISATQVGDLQDQVSKLNKELKVSYFLTAVGVVIFIARYLLA